MPPGPSRRQTFNGSSPFNHASRSWNDNGVRYQTNSSSYVAPSGSFAFGIMGTTARSQDQPGVTSVQQRPQRSGLFGRAFGLLEDMLEKQSQLAQRESRRNTKRSSVEDLAYGDDFSAAQPRTLFSDFPANSNSPQRRRKGSLGRTQSPPQRSRRGEPGRSRSYRTEDYKSGSSSRAAYVEDDSDDDSQDSSDYSEPRNYWRPRRAFTQNDASIIQSLEDKARYHQKEAKKCRDNIQRMSGHPMFSAEALQQQVDGLKRNERAHQSARESLETMRSGAGGNSSRSKQSPSDSKRSNRRHERNVPRGEPYNRTSPNDFYNTFFQAHRDPFFDHFDEFGPFAGTPFAQFHRSFFNDFPSTAFFADGTPHFFAHPFTTNSRGFSSTGQQGNARFQPQTFSTFSAPSQPTPPANLLKPDEAKRLFKAYDERWLSLGPTDPSIPYPARKLHPTGLLVRDSIWAPTVSSPIAEWSEETVMQANTQAFFLGVVGLSPHYTEAPGTHKIVISYNKAKANPAQVKALVDMLKKEKARWHSDRLGRRNAGMTGTNEALQRDEKARAVFHAVCELMEAAQGA